MLVDLHVHSEGGVREMLQHAKNIGLDALAFTDDAQFEKIDEIRAASQETGVKAFCGAAVHTNRGILLCFVPDVDAVRHNGAWFASESEKLPIANDVVAAVEKLGGAVVAAHPYYKAIESPMGDNIFSIVGLHACEAASPLAPGMQRDLAIEASESLGLPCVGGSAARTSAHIGMAATLFVDEIMDEAMLCKQIRDKRCYAIVALNEVPAGARASTPAQPRFQNRGPRRRRRGPGSGQGSGQGGSGQGPRQGPRR